MLTNRIFRIDKLILSIPDDLEGTGSNGEVTIDDALAFLLKHRQTEVAKAENLYGNYEYMSGNVPDGMNPINPLSMTSEALLEYVVRNPVICAGVMAMVKRDFDIDESGPYRNIYNADEMLIYKKTLRKFKESKAEAEKITKDQSKFQPSEEDTMLTNHKCFNCENICDENCPDYSDRADKGE